MNIVMPGVLWKRRVGKLEEKCEFLTTYLLQWRYRDTDIKQLGIAKNSSVLNYLVLPLLVFWINSAIMASTVS